MSNDTGVERTLVLLKPDAVARGLIGRVLSRFEDQMLKVVASRMVCDSSAISAGMSRRQTSSSSVTRTWSLRFHTSCRYVSSHSRLSPSPRR